MKPASNRGVPRCAVGPGLRPYFAQEFEFWQTFPAYIAISSMGHTIPCGPRFCQFIRQIIWMSNQTIGPSPRLLHAPFHIFHHSLFRLSLHIAVIPPLKSAQGPLSHCLNLTLWHLVALLHFRHESLSQRRWSTVNQHHAI